MGLQRERLVEWLGATLGASAKELTDDTPLFSSNRLDSLRLLQLVVFIEREAGVRMKASEVRLDNLDTIGRILAYSARIEQEPRPRRR